jgi:hypothetical protein
MTNTTLMNFNIPNQIKNDFKTVCTFNQSTMTSEIVRFINSYITSESVRLKSYQVSSKELNELKQRKLTPTTRFHPQPRTTTQNTWETSY